MRGFLARRTAALGVTVLLASFVVFLIPYVTPGDPVRKIIRSQVQGELVDESAVQGLTAELGLDDPLPVQYVRWLSHFVSGDMGLSYTSRTPVIEHVMPALWITLSLTVVTLAVAAIAATALGTLAALREGRLTDRVITALTQALIAMPEYWLAPVLVLVFALNLSVLPSAGWSGPSSMVLPVAVLAIRPLSHFTSAVREGMLDALGGEHVLAARARGLSHSQTVFRHVIPNGLLPLTTLTGVWFAGLLGGSVIVEVIFAIPGMGRLLYDAVLNSDIPLAQGGVVFVVVLAVVLTTAGDLLHAVLNPKMRNSHA
ncbi:ABC transporter permease [Sinomonas mesophila]|uniref:ABC transporter permease n=1 Tax=Sinomonas mesophila TaxID=1531955 RepID=UPI000987980B|nr:ABC transporter permease [Sinomonas mesophila]